jgi:hypothetical protein
MAVVPAHMALAGDFRAMLRRADFLDRQRVQLGAEQNGQARESAVVDDRDAGTSKACHNPVGHRIGKKPLHLGSRRDLLA